MTAEKTQGMAQPQNLTDAELENVTGGMEWYQDTKEHRFFHWAGGNNLDEKYRCPNCDRLLHYGTGWRYYCDPCNESWFYESDLTLNLGDHLWKEVSWSDWYEANKVALH